MRVCVCVCVDHSCTISFLYIHIYTWTAYLQYISQIQGSFCKKSLWYTRLCTKAAYTMALVPLRISPYRALSVKEPHLGLGFRVVQGSFHKRGLECELFLHESSILLGSSGKSPEHAGLFPRKRPLIWGSCRIPTHLHLWHTHAHTLTPRHRSSPSFYRSNKLSCTWWPRRVKAKHSRSWSRPAPTWLRAPRYTHSTQCVWRFACMCR